jgi:hypothetical protein
MNQKPTDPLDHALQLLDLHHGSFWAAESFAKGSGHPVPCDTRGWSQVLVTVLTGRSGRNRKKGSDFIDGSDVKGANTWEAIDRPRFNGVIKAGTKAESSGKLASLDNMPYLFFVLWDHSPTSKRARCRVWCVRPQKDRVFRRLCASWYDKRPTGEIKSANFQLHPPRGKHSNEFRNTCGNLLYPLLLCAEHEDNGFKIIEYHPEVMTTGECQPAAERDTAAPKQRDITKSKKEAGRAGSGPESPASR